MPMGRSEHAPSSPQHLIEQALDAARPGGELIVIADEHSTVNLRWAANTLTTNGVASTRSLTVIAIDRDPDGRCGVGTVSRSGVRSDQVADLVREAEKAAADASPAEDAGGSRPRGRPVMNSGRTPKAPGGTMRRRAPRSPRCAGSRPRSGRRCGRHRARGGSCTASLSTR